jgi:putative ABC transport system ATP-binding protein
MKNVIKCVNVWKVYNPHTPAEVQALRGVNLAIDEGDMVGIMGTSGSGKSTLLNMIGALDKPSRGKILIDGQDISHMNENQLAVLRRKKIGFVFQFFNLINSLTAFGNVELPMVFNGLPPENRKKKVKELLELVDLSDKIHEKPNKLSGGQSQRLAIARALANDPAVILADEPTGNLDSKTGANIMNLFKKLNKDGRTIIIVTHDANIARQSSRIVRVADGKVLEEFI